VEEFWEIGPGLGALTGPLLSRVSVPVRAFELDRKLAAYLREKFPRLDLREGDVNYADFAAVSPGRRIAVLSNLPYHLSSPILFKLFEEKARIARMVLTFQKEYAERLVARPRTPDYGALSVMCQLHFSLSSLGVLPPGAFYPVPGVASEAVLFEPKASVPDIQLVGRVLKAAFRQRRKKLSSNLKQAYPTANAEEALAALGLSPTVRPEELSKEQYVALAALIKAQISEGNCPEKNCES